jgi:argininosuccinate lyase
MQKTRHQPKKQATKKTRAANPLWGGRFGSAPAAVMEKINASIGFDKKLYAQDIRASQAHADMLARRGIVARRDAARIRKGLDAIRREIDAGRFPFSTALEDIHMNVEARLTSRIGDAGKRLHTARSRNDQVATDFRLWVRDALDATTRAIAALQSALIAKAERHAETIMPGFTHLQNAQPVTFGHHLLAYVEMLGRDRSRAEDARKRLNESPLGAAALAGTPYPIDRRMTAKALGFDRPMANSIDAVSDRDFALEFLALAAISAVHLSRLAEELVIWASPQFGFVKLSDAFTTGSSIMPQKRNPDAAELIRAKAGRVIGALVSLLVVMKGLPLAYSKDMQEDKEPVFDGADTLLLALHAMAGMIADLKADSARMKAAAEVGHTTATDLADWLVWNAGLTFRNAHHVAGRLVRLAESKGVRLKDLALKEMQAVEPKLTRAVYRVLDVAASAASRRSEGGTAPARVRNAVKDAKHRFAP